ncbi:MAG: hypothetical protein CVT86_03470 [Alphaproteobacteria bacterium HGW-Alphaproteobacteria-8]|nr:MAG: hypothetical protein CVT86_03470 [Alphaproteobacteria bacterium HGW-Alphaproteobacteria-8]
MLSYEVIPSAQVALNLDAATYEQRAALTQAVLDDLAPRVLAAAGLAAEAVRTELTPGGYLLKTNASLQARGAMTENQAIRAAAALGYVFRQWSVLVSRLDDEQGDTGYVVMAFPDGALTPDLAQDFFESAAAVDEGLGGGYTAFGDEMIFFNVRDGDHQPYSGLDDMAFAAKLGQTAGRFEAAPVTVAAAGYAAALFVGNDWEAAPGGEDYAAGLDDAGLVAALDGLRAEHTALVERMAGEFGWR